MARDKGGATRVLCRRTGCAGQVCVGTRADRGLCPGRLSEGGYVVSKDGALAAFPEAVGRRAGSVDYKGILG